MENKYCVSKELKKYIRRILCRCFYSFHFEENTDGNTYCYTNCPENAFYKVVDRAKCERLSERNGKLYLTEKEAQNVGFQIEMQRITGKNSFLVVYQEELDKQ